MVVVDYSSADVYGFFFFYLEISRAVVAADNHLLVACLVVASTQVAVDYMLIIMVMIIILSMLGVVDADADGGANVQLAARILSKQQQQLSDTT